MNKRLIIFGLLLLTLFISGCTTVIVEAEPPIMNKLSIISDTTANVDIACYNDNISDNYKYFYEISILNDDYYEDLSKTTETDTKIINNDDLRIINNLIYPDLNYIGIEAYYKIEKNARNKPNYCELKHININYKLTEYINNKLISEELMRWSKNSNWNNQCVFEYGFNSCILHELN